MTGKSGEKSITPPDVGDFSQAWHSLEKSKGVDAVQKYGITKRTSGDHIGMYKNENVTGYTWHHVEDLKTMQLIDEKIHALFTHKWGASL